MHVMPNLTFLKFIFYLLSHDIDNECKPQVIFLGHMINDIFIGVFILSKLIPYILPSQSKELVKFFLEKMTHMVLELAQCVIWSLNL